MSTGVRKPGRLGVATNTGRKRSRRYQTPWNEKKKKCATKSGTPESHLKPGHSWVKKRHGFSMPEKREKKEVGGSHHIAIKNVGRKAAIQRVSVVGFRKIFGNKGTHTGRGYHSNETPVKTFKGGQTANKVHSLKEEFWGWPY